MNPYETLGVPADADAAAIRRAYRARAKKCHPDGGGSTEQFGALRRAHDVLTNPERREKYDRTGDIEEETADTGASLALRLISGALDQALGKIDGRGGNVEQAKDMIPAILSELTAERSKAKELIANLGKVLAINERLAGRFSVEGEGPNRLDALVNGRIGMVRGAIESNKRRIAAYDEALKIVSEHRFKADPAPDAKDKYPSMMFLFNFNHATTTTTGTWR